METVDRLRNRLSRARCELIGCICAPDYPACSRCNAALYDDFIGEGKLHWLFLVRERWILARNWVRRKISGRKCEQCGRKFRCGYNDYLCSEECHDEWLPF